MHKPFEIVFEDDYIIVLNKIAKILTQPSPKNEKFTLTLLLKEKLKKEVYPCHRLDRETTGLIIYAKDTNSQKLFMEDFKKRKIEKKYIAFVKGHLTKKEGFLKDYILDREGKLFGEKPKIAETFYKVIKEYQHFSVLMLKPLTGRTNQLRIQLAKVGHPILGERKYAFGKDFEIKFKRLALHAYFLRFFHPITKKHIQIKIELPTDMKNFLNKYTLLKTI
ncbi:MAG: RluA family pseudouridine synthase [Candidatus Omnitrophica bacterium]|nr:RluA family pseudouridine synthase [Candidatus Omnitrophota bacterium]